MNWTAIVTAAVAVYGAALSTYTLIQNRKEKRRQIRVKLSNGFLTSGPELSPAMLLIEATNPGNRTVILNTVGISLPDKKTLAFPIPHSNVRFPHPLPEGNSCLVWTPLKELAQQLRQEGYSGKVKLVGFYRDQVGTQYSSNAFAFEIDGWTN
ncbi:MAG: hypothetical protein ACLQVJ_15060 [Syntrophobacteraceae bacterium]